MKWIRKSGLDALLPDLLKTRVYVGVSAGSMVTNKDLILKTSQMLYGEDLGKTENVAALNYVDFYFLPHLNSDYFTRFRKKNLEEAVKGMTEKVYALDDNSALKVVDGNVEIVSEGEYLEFN
jgi:dipeptidase E